MGTEGIIACWDLDIGVCVCGGGGGGVGGGGGGGKKGGGGGRRGDLKNGLKNDGEKVSQMKEMRIKEDPDQDITNVDLNWDVPLSPEVDNDDTTIANNDPPSSSSAPTPITIPTTSSNPKRDVPNNDWTGFPLGQTSPYLSERCGPDWFKYKTTKANSLKSYRASTNGTMEHNINYNGNDDDGDDDFYQAYSDTNIETVLQSVWTAKPKDDGPPPSTPLPTFTIPTIALERHYLNAIYGIDAIPAYYNTLHIEPLMGSITEVRVCGLRDGAYFETPEPPSFSPLLPLDPSDPSSPPSPPPPKPILQKLKWVNCYDGGLCEFNADCKNE